MPESEYYGLIKQKIKELLIEKIDNKNIYLEITFKTGLSDKLKQAIPREREIIFSFLAKKPDITGIIKKQYYTDYIILEIKKEKIKLKDIYQAKMYKELLGARYTFLVTLKPIPDVIKRLCKVNFGILRSVGDNGIKFFVLTYFDKETNNFVEWFEENPFKNNRLWQ